MLSREIKSQDIAASGKWAAWEKILESSAITSHDILKLLAVSKELAEFLLSYYRHKIQIAPGYSSFYTPEKFSKAVFGELHPVFQGVRDYFILKHIQDLFCDADKVNYDYVFDLAKKLGFIPFLIEASSEETKPGDSVRYERALQSIRQYNQRIESKAHEIVKDKLSQCEVKDVEQEITKINTYLVQHTAIVVTFNLKRLKAFKEKTFLNFFQNRDVFKSFLASEDVNRNEYHYRRLTTEILHYLGSEVHDLIDFLTHPSAHPCYGVLQFYHQITPVTKHGNNFIVFTQTVKEKSTGIFGAPSCRMDILGERLKPVCLSGSVEPLIAQFSPDLLKKLVEAREDKPFPRDYDMQMKAEKTEYIEVQLPPNMRLDDPHAIAHVHVDFSADSSLDELEHLMKSNITVSIGHNPFQLPEFSKAYQAGEIQPFIKKSVLEAIYQSALFIGETTEEFLKMSLEGSALCFRFKIITSSPQFHQAQASALLYLLGVRKIFDGMAAIALDKSELDFSLPLDGSVREEGDLADHDAYTNEIVSLRQLLHVFLKRIFLILLASLQNEEYLFSHNTAHPVTGAGATEEENQTRELRLGDPHHPYDILVHWYYSSIVIEVLTQAESQIDFVFKSLKAIFPALLRVDNKFLISLSTPALLEELLKKRFAYQAIVIYENEGDLLLAYRGGFATPGGHNNDPFARLAGLFSDIEFGQVKLDWFALEKVAQYLGTTQSPHTVYYSLPVGHIQSLHEDPAEFKRGSLRSFPVYRLGRLDDSEIAHAAAMLELSRDDYEKLFGRGLVLRPVPSILVYLQFCEGELARLLKKFFDHTSEFKATILSEVDIVEHHKKSYWKPKPQFGKIEIQGDAHYLGLLKTYFSTLRNLACELKESTLCFMSTNPQALIQAIQFLPKDITNHDLHLNQNVLAQFKEKHSAYLRQFQPFRMLEILVLAMENQLDLHHLFNEGDGDILMMIIKEFLARSQASSRSNSALESKETDPSLDEIGKSLKKIIDALWVNSWSSDSNLLRLAVRKYSLAEVRYLMEEVEFYIMEDENDRSELFIACERGDLGIVAYLVESGRFDVTLRNSKRQSVWYVAALYGHGDVVKYLTEYAVAHPDEFDQSEDALKADLEEEAESDDDRRSILHLALWLPNCRSPEFSVIYSHLLCLFKPAISMRMSRNRTPIFLAAAHNFPKIVKLLVAEKADININGDNGLAVITAAIQSENSETVKLLVEYVSYQHFFSLELLKYFRAWIKIAVELSLKTMINFLLDYFPLCYEDDDSIKPFLDEEKSIYFELNRRIGRERDKVINFKELFQQDQKTVIDTSAKKFQAWTDVEAKVLQEVPSQQSAAYNKIQSNYSKFHIRTTMEMLFHSTCRKKSKKITNKQLYTRLKRRLFFCFFGDNSEKVRKQAYRSACGDDRKTFISNMKLMIKKTYP